ncbi:MAG: preprotein translocase subunit SecA, partial [bacterium]
MRPFDVQLLGGIILHQGRIAEMRTGEGKTLAATMPLYLNGLSGDGAHLVTVNDYLARRDSEWMGTIFKFLGLSVGCLDITEPNTLERRNMYKCDITYGTNNEFGFDYLRDNMAHTGEECVQRNLNYAIVDEVDSILIDESRTPLIISGPTEISTDKYSKVNRIIPHLMQLDKKNTGQYYTKDEKNKNVTLTEQGVYECEKMLGVDNIYHDVNSEWVHHINQALKAHTMFQKNVDYVIKDNQVIIVDDFTGRLMEGRRWSDGLHQAVEAKEHVKIATENQTLATITFQNFFRLYNKLAGMTGTADTEAREFAEIYKLDVTVVPTHKKMIRNDMPDRIYRTNCEKDNAIIQEIMENHKKGRPILVGTISVEYSEGLSRKLQRQGIPHNVLNAKQHASEAEIVAQAGRKGAVTIATNMAGRGTDIVLGGNPQALAYAKADPDKEPEKYNQLFKKYSDQCLAEKTEVINNGGLHIVGTERHESRRIDNQLRGRAGRQGDPGSSVFFLSLEDDLMRIFGGDRLKAIMDRLGAKEGDVITHNMVSRAIEKAQSRVEAHNFEIRKHLLEYDNVMDVQRNTIYKLRRQILDESDIKEEILDRIRDAVQIKVKKYTDPRIFEENWDTKGLIEDFNRSFSFKITQKQLDHKNQDDLTEDMIKIITNNYTEKETRIGGELMRIIERNVLLGVIDKRWKDNL